MVRLLHFHPRPLVATFEPVSIPQWCDCCTFSLRALKRRSSVSIPQWCDCCSPSSPSISHGYVSIPQWCDCCLSRYPLRQVEYVVSIPQWCDCCVFNRAHRRTKSAVSIPQWCDCCAVPFGWIRRKAEVSIPQWCDCCDSAAAEHNARTQSFNPTMVRLLLLGLRGALFQGQ